MSAVELSSAEARRLSLRAQLLLGAADRRAGVAGLLRGLGAVQLDTISVLARNHELVAYARLGPVGRPRVEAAYWGQEAAAFEYWAHAASILPLDWWPYFAFRRRRYRDKYVKAHLPTRRKVLAELRARGPLTATDLGGAKKGGIWWDWSDAKVAVELLLMDGEVVCTTRRGWKRVYDLAERALPPDLLAAEPDDLDCLVHLVRAAGRRLGVGTLGDLADYFRMRRDDTLSAVEEAGLVEVSVRGWPERAWADPGLLEDLGAGRIRGRHRTTLLSPFDSLVWDRARTLRVFDFHHRLEAYVPKPKRVHGYFAMPLLAGGRLVGRVDPARESSHLVARTLSVEPRAIPSMARALAEAASWVGLDGVALERVTPDGAAAPLRAELDALGA